MKTVIALSNISDKGKSDTLREFAKLILSSYPILKAISPIPISVPISGDFRCVIEINNVVVGIESQGDPTTNLRKRLNELTDQFNCEIILCSSRTRGETIDAVNNFASSRGFQIILTSTYQIVDQSKHQLVNQLKAKHLLDLLQSMNLL
jgi:hypothetical protein